MKKSHVFVALIICVCMNAASAYGEQKRLEPMAPDTKERWKREIDWLLSVTDHVVEFVPIKQKAKDGSIMEVRTSMSLSLCPSLSF